MVLMGVAVWAACVALRMALQRQRLEVLAQGGRYRLTRELHGLRGGIGEWIGEATGAGVLVKQCEVKWDHKEEVQSDPIQGYTGWGRGLPCKNVKGRVHDGAELLGLGLATACVHCI
jgi:hypothetical protein